MSHFSETGGAKSHGRVSTDWSGGVKVKPRSTLIASALAVLVITVSCGRPAVVHSGQAAAKDAGQIGTPNPPPSTVTTGVGPHATVVPAAGGPSPTVGHWRMVDAGPLATRGEPHAVWTGKEVIVVGGLIIDQYQALDDGAAFDPNTETWRRIAPRPRGRVLNAVWTGDEVVTFAGDSLDPSTIANGFAYSPTTDTWRPVPLPASKSTPRELVWTGSRVLAWQPTASTGALYDPATDAWTAMPDNTVPGAVSVGVAAWTGKELAIEGAVTPDRGGPVEQRLFLFDPERMSWRVSAKPPAELNTWPFLDAGVSAGGFVVSGVPNGSPPLGQSTTLIYDTARDRWRSVAAPFPQATYPTVSLADRILVQGQGPFNVLDARADRWSSSGTPPGPVVGDGAVVPTDANIFVFGITSSDGTVMARAPNAAYLWSDK